MAENTPAPKRQRPSRAKAAAPAAEKGAAAAAEAVANATTENNPASTTKAGDPARDTAENAALAASTSGTNDPANQPAATVDENGKSVDPAPASPDAPLIDATAGNRHSHPAQTTAEATLAAQTSNAAPSIGDGAALPAAEDADPNGPAGTTDGGNSAAGTETILSVHDETGSVQDAVREAIGAGTGAPDGVGDVGADPSEADVVAPVEAAPGVTFVGGKAKLWPLLEKGATNDELLAASGHNSVLGTIHLMARQAGREIEQIKDRKTGVKTYRLKPAPKAKEGKGKS